jgi:hypothetical protein
LLPREIGAGRQPSLRKSVKPVKQQPDLAARAAARAREDEMRVSKVLMTGFVVVMIAALTFTTVGAQAEPPPAEDIATQDSSIGVDATVVPVSPVNSVVYGRAPYFTFRRNYDAKAYSVQVREYGSGTILYTYQGAYTCTNYVCWMRPDTKLNMAGAAYTGDYEWRVSSKEGTIWHVYSSWAPFYVIDNGFNSTFDVNYKNWNVWDGLWMWDAAKGRIWTTGDVNYYNSMYFSYYFPSFDYTVRMKRKLNEGNTNSLVVWGKPSATTGSHMWHDGYYVNYRNNKQVSIWKVVGGSWTGVFEIVDCAAVVPFGWNEIRVVGIYPYLDLWLNGVYLGYIMLTELPVSYYLGFDMYAGAADQKFLVDWAKVSIPSMSPFAVRDPALELTMQPVAEGAEPPQ